MFMEAFCETENDKRFSSNHLSFLKKYKISGRKRRRDETRRDESCLSSSSQSINSFQEVAGAWIFGDAPVASSILRSQIRHSKVVAIDSDAVVVDPKDAPVGVIHLTAESERTATHHLVLRKGHDVDASWKRDVY